MLQINVQHCSTPSKTHMPSKDAAQKEPSAAITEFFWLNPMIAEDFLAERPYWSKYLATELSITVASVIKTVKKIGHGNLRMLITKNPAGEPPSTVITQKDDQDMVATWGTCGTCTCGSCDCRTGTCGTCTCGTCRC